MIRALCWAVGVLGRGIWYVLRHPLRPLLIAGCWILDFHGPGQTKDSYSGPYIPSDYPDVWHFYCPRCGYRSSGLYGIVRFEASQ